MDNETLLPSDHKSDDPATHIPQPRYDCPVFYWTENFGRYTDSISRLISEVGLRFRDCGLPLTRLSVVVRTLHPQIAVTGYAWNGETDEMSEFTGDHQSQSRASYQRSPVRQIFEGSPGIRRKLLDPDCPRDFPILEDLDAEGSPKHRMDSPTNTAPGSVSSCRHFLASSKSSPLAPSPAI